MVLFEYTQKIKEWADALVFARLPKDPKEMTQEKILLGLQSLGVATQKDLEILHRRIRDLEVKLQKTKLSN